jgi:hypothetical protein
VAAATGRPRIGDGGQGRRAGAGVRRPGGARRG